MSEERAEEYRAHADRVRAQIADSKNPDHRRQLEEIAAIWDRLAEGEERVNIPKKP